MIDIKLLRREREDIEKKLKRKDPDLSVDTILLLDEELRTKIHLVEQWKAERNALSQQVGEGKRKGNDVSAFLTKAESLAAQIHAVDEEIQQLENAYYEILAQIPNIPFDDVPDSQHVNDNVVLKQKGEKPTFSFTPKNHLELNESLKLFDFERSAKITGRGWPLYQKWGARLEWALIQYMLSVQIKNGFDLILPPVVVRKEMMYYAGQLPKFANQQFKLDDPEYPFYLIPTAEVPLNGLHANEIFQEEDLPLRYVAFTPCFRRESGAAGAQERGLIRMHQFHKVEMFVFCKPEESRQMQDWMVECAEEVLEGLGLHYRRMLLVSGDMSFSSARTIDIETWLPGQDRYYEVSSISNCTDYQARRGLIRWKRKGEKKSEFVHTLNGSGLATSRLMVSLLECNQQEDGSIVIPKVLQPYLDGKEKLG